MIGKMPMTDHGKTLQLMSKQVFLVNKANGWYDEDRPFPADIALLHSEVSEAFEGYRQNDLVNIAEEMADIFIRLLDTCHRYNIDLEHEFNLKMEKNAKRGHRHGGKVV